MAWSIVLFLYLIIVPTASRILFHFCTSGYVPWIPLIHWRQMYLHLYWEGFGVRYLKKVYIIGCWTDTDYFMNGNIFILKLITDIQNPGSESMHIWDSNVGSEWVSMFHWTVGLIKINALNLITTTCAFACSNFPCIITVTFLNIFSNEWTKWFFSFREEFDWYGSRNKAEISVLVILQK